MTAETFQAWVAAGGAFLAGVLGLVKYFSYRSKRDRLASVGASFTATVEALASENETTRMAGAVLLRRFFRRKTEQGSAGTPYSAEAIEVIAGLLRESRSERLPETLQKVLADGLYYARDLSRADLQRCCLRRAYLGRKRGDKDVLDLSEADLFEADLSGASLRGVKAVETTFYRARLVETVLAEADLTKADFRAAVLTKADFGAALIGGARFSGAEDIPADVAALLDGELTAPAKAVVPEKRPR
ncbi:Pentapeptide repeat-containing protein [Geodermatophilus obscurus]|uniref:Pentapeptide repeat-containing protein n=1 Tax=Geodermatophilus obscurus TaxID=1861 RepID=A0A1M7T7A5_9ACTN|nr:pentapeptide repeat-containing protein [Geodermatophilus obscurus]SHN66605.1 Pentapeptide repeat-containing protein [Geodermatophilus obscurus]